MKKTIKWKNRALIYTVTLLLFATSIFMACKKNNNDVFINRFDAATAKEWFYGTFKKSAEYQNVNTALTGKKLPEWKTGQYKKAGNIEMVEFDLVQQKKSALINPGTNRTEDTRVAEAAISKAVFIKKNGEITLEIIQFIPERNYLKANSYDISKNSLITPDKAFTGKVLITRWNNDLVKGYNMENGKKKTVIKKIIKQSQTGGDNGTPNTPINPDCYYSYYAWFEQNCTVTPLGDGMSIETCSNWELIWDNVVETSCPVSQSECEEMGLSTEDCMCQVLGLCSGDGDANQDEAIIEEFNNAKTATWSYVTNLDFKCINTSVPYTYQYNNWLIAKHGFGWWDVTANSRWVYATSNGSINITEFVPISTALNTHTLMIFNTIYWTQGNMTNNALNFNFTSNPKGTQIVTGSVKIRSKIPTAVGGLLDTGQQSAEGTLNVNFHL